MTDSVKRQAQLMRCGAILAPVLTVLLIRYAGPEQSLAGTMVDPYEVPAIPTVPSFGTEPEGILGAAAAHARRLFEAGINGDPFPASEVAVATPDSLRHADAPTPARMAPPSMELPDLRVTAVMSRRGGAIAVINSRICAVGARVAPGWTLDAVDEQSRTLVIQHADGRRVELGLNTP